MAAGDFLWTDQAVTYLRELFDAGSTASQIATALNERFGSNLTRNAIIGKWKRLGLSNTRVTTPARKVKEAAQEDRSQAKKARRKKPLPAAVESAATAIPVSTRVSLLELRLTHCRFPYGDPRDDDFGFCGAAVPIGSTYCAGHYALCYQPVSDRARWDRRLGIAAASNPQK